MVMQLRLSGNYGKFLNDTEYIKAENDKVTIEIVTNFGCNTILFAKINNGVEEKTIKIKGRKFDIENDFLNVGECQIKIIAKLGSRVVGEYTCTPLTIIEINNERMIVDKLREFEITIHEFLKEYQEEKDYIRFELNRMRKSLKELIIAE